MINIGTPAPDFELECVSAGADGTQSVSLGSYAGRWLALIFYPRDFSFVCPTELTSFSARLSDFRRLNCELLGVSIDSVESHRQWLSTPPDDGGLGPLRFPLGSDPDGRAARAFGVWGDANELPNRGLFVIDPEGRLQYAVVHNLSVGRNPDEVLRVLEALQTGGLCPASWTSADGTIDPQQMLKPGRVVGHYRIEELVGHGTFGTVFSATDLRLKRKVALKVLKLAIDQSRSALLEEARAAAGVDHPYVCTIYAADEHDGLPVIAMRYVAGRPLSELVGRGLEPPRFRVLAARITKGLAAAHRHNVVHGDLKPANILIGPGDHPSIVDFGLAASRNKGQFRVEPQRGQFDTTIDWDPAQLRRQPTSSGARLDETTDASSGSIAGTPAYMSPEQAQGDQATASSDVFSLGLIFSEMLTGQRVLHESSLVRMLQALQNENLADRVAGRVQSEFGDLINSMLQRDPSRRPSSTEVATALADLRDR